MCRRILPRPYNEGNGGITVHVHTYIQDSMMDNMTGTCRWYVCTYSVQMHLVLPCWETIPGTSY